MAMDAPNQASAFAPIMEARSTAPHACMMASSISGEIESSGSGSEVRSGGGPAAAAAASPGRDKPAAGSFNVSDAGTSAAGSCLPPPNQREKVEACLTLCSPKPTYGPLDDGWRSSCWMWENEVETSGQALRVCC